LLVRSNELSPAEISAVIGAPASECATKGSRRTGLPPVPRYEVGVRGLGLDAHQLRLLVALDLEVDVDAYG
jgi:hypothetical protein